MNEPTSLRGTAYLLWVGRWPGLLLRVVLLSLGASRRLEISSPEAEGTELVDPEAPAAWADQMRIGVDEAEVREKILLSLKPVSRTFPDSTWWTDRVLPALDADTIKRKLAYILVWPNTNDRSNSAPHFAPYPRPSERPELRALL